ncbi:GNAT family N-acetyltransferase [Cohnella nanjingensis]|uniref:GNAT family N-acetyltransferase n=1 Tax=Cohnella nanjingensis TaxID=1387779 RepID=A0A7X0RS67_9BACL|nr:GNAT family N-acetyltransferase [Cohnella nanjingensis]MBB6672692.1 GNAT family N-acetyltransferase [Cohnella nanjingensis]
MTLELTIRPLAPGEDYPYDLLLLADPSRTMVDDYLTRGWCHVATLGSDVVGEFVLIPTHPRTIEIVNVAVMEAHQGRGIGKALVYAAIGEAKRRGAATVEIGTGNSGFLQLKLYQQCGFRIVGVDPDFFVRHYDEPLYEDGMQVRDMVRLRMLLE